MSLCRIETLKSTHSLIEFPFGNATTSANRHCSHPDVPALIAVFLLMNEMRIARLTSTPSVCLQTLTDFSTHSIMTSSPSSSSSETMMPQWIDDCHMDPKWLWSKTKVDRFGSVNKICVQDITTNPGRLGGSIPRNGGTLLLQLESSLSSASHQDKEKDDSLPCDELVLKQIIPEHGADLSKRLGLAREALFYAKLAPRLYQNENILPRIYYAHGNMDTGEKCLVMESLASWVDSGIFFKPRTGDSKGNKPFWGNPNNWSRDLDCLLANAYGQPQPPQPSNIPTTKVVAQSTFVAAAAVHAAYWRDQSLLEASNDWLRAHAWIQGRGKESWEASQSLIQTIWNDYTSSRIGSDGGDGGRDVSWNPVVRQAVEKCIAGISWDAQLERLHVDGRWTLVHGDFFPGNVMWNPAVSQSLSSPSSPPLLRLLDWEMVGVGSGPQDLGQYVISNMDPVDRRSCEYELVQAYYQELLRCGVEDSSNDLWEYCWKEYKIGGVERWLWFLVYFLSSPNLVDWALFFHDQISSFMDDHGLTAADLTQPRP